MIRRRLLTLLAFCILGHSLVWAEKFTVDSGCTLTTSLIAHWNLDEASGTRVDAKGGNDLTDNNTVTQATGIVSNAGQFTAANSEYLSIADNAALSTGDIDFTIPLWARAGGGGMSLPLFMTKKAGPGAQIPNDPLLALILPWLRSRTENQPED